MGGSAPPRPSVPAARDSDTAAVDQVGERTLELFEETGGYSDLLWDALASLSPPRGRVLEVGCGIGTLTRKILSTPGVDALHAIDMEPVYVERVRRAIEDDRLTVTAASLESFRPPRCPEAADEAFDTIVCSNVLEHIEDDRRALAEFQRMLRPGGHALVLVPAHPSLYCGLDRELSHFRRYRREQLVDRATAASLEVSRVRYFNPLGVVGWWLNGKVLRRRVLPPGQLRMYSRLAVSISRILDRCNPLPVGISVIACLRRPGASGR